MNKPRKPRACFDEFKQKEEAQRQSPPNARCTRSLWSVAVDRKLTPEDAGQLASPRGMAGLPFG
jgi:hypothetical protein